MNPCEHCGGPMVLDKSVKGTDGNTYEYWRCLDACDGEQNPLDEPWELTDLDRRFLRVMQISQE